MSSVVVFPFVAEDPRLVLKNVRIAAEHSRVAEVVAVGATEKDIATLPSAEVADVTDETGTTVSLLVQDRIGNLRSGKGDAMNTALHRFPDSDHARIHFYDADITNFGPEWIEKAEVRSDEGFDVVRHYFQRASTDAMITWMLTRPGFALTHPETNLWKVAQPLGGELLLSRDAAQHLVADDRVAHRSDWGIDTLITFSTVAAGYDVAEVFIPEGKQHGLYGSLSDLWTMVVECFDAVASLREDLVNQPGRYQVEPSSPAGAEIATRVAYSVERTLPLLGEGWSDSEADLARSVPHGDDLVRNRDQPSFEFCDPVAWPDILTALFDRADPSDPDWQSVIFRFWVARVLAYTTSTALSGHAHAMAELERSVTGYSRTP